MKIANFASADKTQRHFLLIGGFLGASKTTLIGCLTRALEEGGRKVARITNDQGDGLMDTASARQASQGLANVAEITGGCFCCRLDELVDFMKALDATTRPEVMIAEPVGSCTDLIISRPLLPFSPPSPPTQVAKRSLTRSPPGTRSRWPAADRAGGRKRCLFRDSSSRRGRNDEALISSTGLAPPPEALRPPTNSIMQMPTYLSPLPDLLPNSQFSILNSRSPWCH